MKQNIETLLADNVFEETKKENNFAKVNQKVIRYLGVINDLKEHDTELFRKVLIHYKEYYNQYGGERI